MYQVRYVLKHVQRFYSDLKNTFLKYIFQDKNIFHEMILKMHAQLYLA